MDDLEPVRASAADQAVVFVRPHTWILAWLYLGSFGSFIGLAAGLPLVAELEFAGADLTPYVFVGPLLAALARPAGGWFADQLGGARVALASFAVMAAVVLALLARSADGRMGGDVGAFVGFYTLLFVGSGMANGAVSQLIPAVFIAGARRRQGRGAGAESRALREGTLEGAAALGLASAIAAFGGFFIPKAFGTAVAITGGTAAALYPFVVFYASCVVVTWWFYVRRRREPAC